MFADDTIEDQYGSSSYDIEKYSHEEMHWSGYIYRYWAHISEKTSKQIYQMMKPGELRKLFFPYHSLDPFQVIERITDDLNLAGRDNINNISAGVNILRKVRFSFTLKYAKIDKDTHTTLILKNVHEKSNPPRNR